MPILEDLNTFYLGKIREQNQRAEPLLLPSQDLCTHAFCVGMTGSGKTGLCLDVLEEAALDGIPALVLDPKGDLANLLLQFPELRAADFQPWVGDQEPGAVAQKWKTSLEEWGMDPERIRRLKERVSFALYTPGNREVAPLSFSELFRCPPPAEEGNEAGIGQEEAVSFAVSSLLTWLGLDADPLQSRELILLSQLLQRAWEQGEDRSFLQLMQEVQHPPLEKLGALPLESVYPEKEREKLLLRMNSLLANPQFASWMEGEPFSIRNLLYDADGKAKISILSLAHLNDRERMFCVSFVCGALLNWMRTQPGSQSLRALFYMDEIYGYFPPSANPPSKKPLLILLKQARAFGLGLILATQNPVDLDYKALANCGIWWMGKMQTQRDRGRMLEGLEQAGELWGESALDRNDWDQILAQLPKRCFLQKSIHQDQAIVFETRQCLSYLAGPLTLPQLKRLLQENLDLQNSYNQKRKFKKEVQIQEEEQKFSRPLVYSEKKRNVQEKQDLSDRNSERPQLPVQIPVAFLKPALNEWSQSLVTEDLYARWAAYFFREENTNNFFLPCLGLQYSLYYTPAPHQEKYKKEQIFLIPFDQDTLQPDWSLQLLEEGDCTWFQGKEPIGAGVGLKYAKVVDTAGKSASYTSWKRHCEDWLSQEQVLPRWYSSAAQSYSKPDESREDFRIRVQAWAREDLDARIQNYKEKKEKELAQLQNRLERASRQLDQKKDRARQEGIDTVIALGSSLLSNFLGLGRGRSAATTISTAARHATRAVGQHQNLEQYEESVETLEVRLQEITRQMEEDLAQLRREHEQAWDELRPAPLGLQKKDLSCNFCGLVWVYWKEN